MRALFAGLALAGTCLATPAFAQGSPYDFAGAILAGAPDAAALDARCDEYVAEIERRFAELEGQQGPATVASVLKPFDDLGGLIYVAGAEYYSFSQSMDTPEKRQAGVDCYTRISEIETRLGLSRAVYDRLAAVDAAGEDTATQRYLSDTLEGFERSGVALEGDDRDRFQALQEELTELSSQFSQNYANARVVIKALPRELAGLPQDWLDAHPVGADGMVDVSTDSPDSQPVMQYSQDDELRERVARASFARAFPENSEILGRIFTLRDEMARLLGRPDYATLALENRMLTTPAEVEAHMAELAAAASEAAASDMAQLQAVLDAERGGAPVTMFNSGWATQQVLRDRYDLDPQAVRQYFTYDNVRDGVLSLSEDLFQVDIREWDTPLWHPDVEAYQIFDGGELMGSFYLDSHPRPGKYQHANHIALRRGVAGETLPVSVLTMNLPAGGYETGLMEHGQVETFLHEFGHLLHNILGGGQRWFAQSGVSTERDFVEAPSQMLENWVYDYDTLARFARNSAGEVIPRDMVERMNAARIFGNGVSEMGQLGYSNASLRFHQGAPEDATAQGISDAYRRYFAVYDPLGERPDGTHQEATFSHLDGYSAGYYTYGWSRVIAADLFSRFEAAGLRDPEAARAYRDLVLARGGSKPAAELIEDFLGRPVNADAFRASLVIDDAED